MQEQQLLDYKFESGFLSSESYSFIEKEVSRLEDPDYSEYFNGPVKYFDTIVISDLHLGHRFSRSRELLVFLNTAHFKRLIINGDVFDDINMKRLNKMHWQILDYLRDLTDCDNGVEVTWIRGNHDGYSDLISKLLGIEFKNEVMMTWANKSVLIIHGDIFDHYVSKYKWLGDIASTVYQFFLFLDPQNRRIGSWLKRTNKTFIRNAERVREAAISYAKRKGAQIVICGHTHFAEEGIHNGVLYINSGSWTDAPSHFIGITKDEIKVVPFS